MRESTTTERSGASSALPEGTIPVAAGLVISGICAFAFLALVKGNLPDDELRVVQQLWFWTFFLAPGFFLPLEQEVARALSHRRSLHQGSLPIVRRAAAFGAAIVAFVSLALLAIRPLLTEHTFDGRTSAVPFLMLSVAAWGTAHLARGVLAGSGRFGPYGMLMGIDGMLRVAGCVLLAGTNHATMNGYLLLIGVPPLLAVGISALLAGHIADPGPEAPWNEVTSKIGWLVVGSVVSAFLVNAGPLLAAPLASVADQTAVATYSTTSQLTSRLTAFSYAILLSRIPLFMFQAVQASLLPKLARLAALGQWREFRRGFRLLMKVVGVVGVIGMVGASIVGPQAVGLAYKVRIGHFDMAILAAAASVYMGTVAIAQALIALHRHASVSMGWVLSLVGIGVGLSLSSDLLRRVEFALILGAAVPLAVFSWMFVREMSTRTEDSSPAPAAHAAG